MFRTCDVTGLRVHRPAEALIKANAVAAVVSLAIGGVYAILVALSRWPAVHLLNGPAYYRVLTGHGLNMLLFWIIFFEVAGLYFGGAVLLNSRLAAPALGWLAFALMVAGAGLVNVMILQGKADVLMTSYYPLRGDPLYYLGVILFAVGALVACGLFFATLFIARKERTYGEGSVPLAVYGLAVAAIIAVVTLLHGAAIYVPTFLWSLGLIGQLDASLYRILWWAMGHSSQQINVAAMVSVWYMLGALTVGATPVNEKICRTAFLLYALFIMVASAHHLLVDPALSPAWKIWNTGYVMHLAILASMIHAMSVIAAVERAQRVRGYARGLFEWLARGPWRNPGFSALALSVVGFGFLGGISGVTYGTEQINIVRHNTLAIPGHFHGTVVAGTTLAFMGLTYYVLPLIFRRQVVLPGLARLQPWVFGLGTYGLAAFLMLAGGYGIPRRHSDIAFGGMPFAPAFDPTATMWLSLAELFGLISVVGGVMYVLVTVGSVFFGAPVGAPAQVTFPVSPPAEPVPGLVAAATAGSAAAAERGG